MSGTSEHVAVWFEADDGQFKQAWCFYNDLFASDLETEKKKSSQIDVYTHESMAPKYLVSVDSTRVFRTNSDDIVTRATDMTALTHLEEPNMLYCLEHRYKRDEIYTNIAGVLVAVNPWKRIPIYTTEHMAKYRNQRRFEHLPPHVFAVAERAYASLMSKGENQSMICCGESGSGKTESTKMLMRYLANIKEIGRDTAEDGSSGDTSGGKVSSVEEQVLMANPILEAFGNASTKMNHNSSRFAKFTKLFVSPEEGRIVGAHTETYLLEKSRVVLPPAGERNYHIFYQLCRGDMAASLSLSAPEDYHYLNAGKRTTSDNISDVDNWKELIECMDSLGFTEEERRLLFRVVAGIANLGNVGAEIEEQKQVYGRHRSMSSLADEDFVLQGRSKEAASLAADLLGVDRESLEKRLKTRTIRVHGGKESYEKSLSVSAAEANRDAIVKSLYHEVFLWIVNKVNATLFSGEKASLGWIGVLDVFGFECFEKNSFEQFCINFANEKLQQFFNEDILKSEQAEYRREGIFWKPINIPDNTDCINLISGYPQGMLCILDSCCKLGTATHESFFTNIFAIHRNHNRLEKAMAPKGSGGARRHKRNTSSSMFSKVGNSKYCGFTIRHYAGKVTYDTEHFLTKNAGSTHPDTVTLFSQSDSPFLRSLFADAVEEMENSQKGQRFESVGNTFNSQLSSLMKTLMATTPYFIRCASPNNLQSPEKFMWEYVQPQLRCGGLVETLRMLKFGYPSRVSYDVIFEKYGHALDPMPVNLNKRNFCEAILVAFGLGRSQYQLGLTKVFFRPGKQEFLESIYRRSEEPLTPEIDAAIRKWLIKRRIQRGLGAVRAFVTFRAAFKKIHNAHMFRKAIRRGMIYIQTLRRTLYRVRRLKHARLNAVPLIQKWWRMMRSRAKLRREIERRVKKRRLNRFKFGAVDAKTQEELNMLRIQMKSAQKKEEMGQKKLKKLEEEAAAKEREMKLMMEAKRKEMEDLQKTMEELKQKDELSNEQQEMITKLKDDTEKLRLENENSAREARLVIQQRELEYKKREEELRRNKEETEKRRQEAELKAQEALQQREEERKQREADLALLKQQTEEMRLAEEKRVQDIQRMIAEKEEENRQKKEQLEKLHAEADRIKQEKEEVSVELQKERDEERRKREEESRTLNAELARLKQEMDQESWAAKEAIQKKEEENRRREAELASLHFETERQKVEHERRMKEQEEKLEAERKKQEEALHFFKEESSRTRELYEKQANEAKEKLLQQEEDSRRKAEALQQMNEEREKMLVSHQSALEEASAAIRKQQQEAEEQLRLMEAEQEATRKQLEEEQNEKRAALKADLEEKLRQTQTEADSEIGRLKAAHQEEVSRWEIMVVEREAALEGLENEMMEMKDDYDKKIYLSKQEIHKRDEELKAAAADMQRMEEAQAAVNQQASAMIEDLNNENSKLVSEHKQEVAELRGENDRLRAELEELKRNHEDLLSHFKDDLKNEAALEKGSAKRGSFFAKTRERNLTYDFNSVPDLMSIIDSSRLNQMRPEDFVAKLRDKRGWLSKRRHENKMFGKKAKVRFHVLNGRSLYWFDKAVVGKDISDNLGLLDLGDYDLVSYDSKAIEDPDFMIKLEPRANRKAKPLLLQASSERKDAEKEDIIEWVYEINKRIAILQYLDETFGENQRGSQPCREIIDFVSGTSDTLRLENKVVDMLKALTIFALPLSSRSNFLRLHLNNVALQDQHVAQLARVLRDNNTLEEVQLMHNELGSKAAEYLGEALRINQSIEVLLLDFNELGDKGAIALGSCLGAHPMLTRMSLSHNAISDTGARAIADGLQSKMVYDKQFPRIDLSDNLIGDSGADALAAVVATNETVQVLDLSHNQVTDTGVVKLSDTLRKNQSLVDVRLSHNLLTNEGVAILSEAVKDRKTLLSLDLSGNRLITRSGVASIVEDGNGSLEFSLLKYVRHAARSE